MACTSQSALKYVENARPHLVGELRNLSVILENLYQQKVLNDEEISKIKAEKDDYDRTRAILNSVTRKGEAACYVFLRIIDQTRRRTLERQTPLFENSHEASTEGTKFDLHHWISCFPFTEDAEMDQNYIQEPRPCYRYQAKLKSKAEKVSKDFWKRSEHLFAENKKPELLYTSLILDIQGKNFPTTIRRFRREKFHSKKLRTYLPENKPEISPRDLLKTDENILLVGKPGIGKSALSHEILRLWSERDDKELDYMFYFDMRKLINNPPIRSLEDLLFTACREPDEGKDEVLQDIKSNSDNVTVILDGVTDLCPLFVEKLVDKDFLPDAKIIITCRPEDEENLSLEDWLRVEVKGFSEEAIKTYLSSTLGENHRKVLSNVELLTLCHVPMYALMVAASFSSKDSLQPRTVTEIYINIVRFGLKMNSNKTGIRNLSQFIKTKRNGILSLAEAAFNATERKTVNLGELSCDDTCVLSFLKTLYGKVPPTESITLDAFLHYTMQEFFAALWLLKNPDKIREVFQQCFTEVKKHMKHLIPFMCCLLNEKSPCLMSCLIPAQEIKETSGWFFKEMIGTFFHQAVANISELHVDRLFVYQCLFESQSSEVCISFLDKLDFHLDLSRANLDPYSCCAVAYVVTQSKERKISLNLQDVMVSEQGMRQLFGCIENVQWVDPLPRQLWTVVFLSEGLTEYMTLLHRCGNQLYLPVVGKKLLFERAVKVMQRSATKVNVCLQWTQRGHIYQSLCESLLRALPYTNHLRFDSQSSYLHGQTRFLVNLFCAAAEREQQTGKKMLETLTSVCRYETFPSYYSDKSQSDFLLDLYSQMKDRETQSGLSLLPSLQSVFQSAPGVWTIKLSERKTSILLEVLKLQAEKQPVELTDCSHGESEVRSFLQSLPFISQLSCPPGFFQSVCSSLSVRSREENQQLVSLLQLLSFKLFLIGELNDKTCSSVEKVLPLCGSKVDLILTDSRMSVRGAALLFRSTTQLHSLRLSNGLVLFLSQWVRRGRVTSPLVLEELSVVSAKAQPQRVLLKVGSSLASLLRFWTVGRLDLTESGLPAESLFSLLLHEAPLRLRLREERLQQLLVVLHEVQDQDRTFSLLNKVGGDLSCCRLSWELLHFLLQQPTAQTITVSLKKNRFLEERAAQLLPFLHRLVIVRPSPSFVRTSIREIFRTHPSYTIPWLLRSLDHVINLNCTELDSRDCDALLFILRYSDGVKLKLLWSSMPAEGLQSILYMLHTVSDLSVDRNLLLRFLHCCAASDSLQGAASGLLRTLQHRLDLSRSSCVELPEEEDQTEPPRLTAADCGAVSTVLKLSSSRDTQLDLRDCEVEDGGLDLLFPVLDRVRLGVDKTVLVQLLCLLHVKNERDTVRRAASLCRALGGEVDLSHRPVDERLCGAVALLLDYCEDVRELDLSHCQLTDQLLLQLSAHLHKVHILDLSHNQITDLSTDWLLRLVYINPLIGSVRLFSNNIINKTPFKDNRKFVIS